jgi:hypothetical protein
MKKLFLTVFVLLGLALVSHAQTKHTIGEKFNGGFVFDVSADSLHGLIAETQDQGSSSWVDAKKLIETKANHSKAGQAFNDWRLPTKDELNKLYLQRTIIGSFTSNHYWSSTEIGSGGAWSQYFSSGIQGNSAKSAKYYVRAVRAF